MQEGYLDVGRPGAGFVEALPDCRHPAPEPVGRRPPRRAHVSPASC